MVHKSSKNILLGYAISWGMAIVLYSVFLTAYFNPKQAVRVTVNQFGEASWEIILLTSCAIYITMVMVWITKNYLKEPKVIPSNE